MKEKEGTTKTKKAAKKVAKTSTRGNSYMLTAPGKKALEAITGQGAVIRDALDKFGSMTSSQLRDKIGTKVHADEDVAKKTIAYYLCVWKSDGHVKFGPKAKAA